MENNSTQQKGSIKGINFDEIAKTAKQKEEMESFKDSIQKTRLQLFKTEEKQKTVTDILLKFTKEEIDNMSYETMLETFVDENNESLFDKKLSKEFVVDLVRYLKVSEDTFKQMDQEFVKYDEAMSEFNKEIDDLVKELGSFNKTFSSSLNDMLNDENITESKRQHILEMQKGISDAITLEPLFTLYEKVNTKNTLIDLRNSIRRTEILKSYDKVCKQVNIKPHLIKLGLLETKLFGEDSTYDKNLFVFILIRYIKYLGKDKLKQPRNNMFVTQIVNFIRELYLPEDNEQVIADKEELDELKRNIKNLLDKFY